MRISAKVDYAVRAAVELAASPDGPVTSEDLAAAQSAPPRFLLNILADLRRHGLVTSARGTDGGWRLARPAKDITVADVIRAVEGPLANVQGVRPEDVRYEGPAAALQDVWVAMRANLRAVLEKVTLADVAAGTLPRSVRKLVDDEDAWRPR